jgi:hypothetical protein
MAVMSNNDSSAEIGCATAPIVLFVYNRLYHTQQTVEALQKNELAEQSDLFIFSDGPKSDNDKEKVLQIREFIRTIFGFKSVLIIERPHNLGLARALIAGITEVVGKYGKIIVLEDDLVTSRYFLKLMNEALVLYENDDAVITIEGYTYDISGLPSTFFLKGIGCWGWSTWKDRWDLFEVDGAKLLRGLQSKKLEKKFDYNDSYPYMQMLKDQIAGKNNSWAIRWNASALLNDKLSLYFGKSLVRNIGIDGSGTHSGNTSVYDVALNDKPSTLNKIPLEENINAFKKFEEFFREKVLPPPSLIRRIKNKMTKSFKRV